MKNAQIEAFFTALQSANPHPATELVYSNEFELLVAVMLSAQATDKSVNLATTGLFRAANTPAQMCALGLPALTQHIRSIGLFRTKASNVLATSAILLEQHAGQVPRTREALEALPGVGRKTANVVLNVAFGEPTLAVDTHIFRVSNRTGLARGVTPLAVEQKLLKRVPKSFLKDAHNWLVLHGRYVCKARQPLCSQCNVASFCDTVARSSVARLGGNMGLQSTSVP